MGKMGSGGDKTAEMSSCVYVKTEEQIQRQAKHGQKIIDYRKSYTACALIKELEATVTELYVHIYKKRKSQHKKNIVIIITSKVVHNRVVRSMFRDPSRSINCNPFLLTPNCPRLT